MKGLASDAPISLLVCAYALVVWALSCFLGDVQKFHPLQYLWGWVLASSVYLITIWALRAIWINPKRPFTAFVAVGRRHWDQGIASRLALIFVMAIFYGVFTSAKNMLPDMHPFSWDPLLASIDYRLLSHHDGWRLAARLIPNGLPLLLLTFVYGNIWGFLMLGFSAYATLSSPPELRRHFLLAFILGWIIAGNILAGLFLSGGPNFYGEITGDHARFLELSRSISGTWAAAERDYLWSAYANHEVWLASGISAFPSIHLVTITLITLLLGRIDTRLFWLGAGLTGLMEIGSVRLGWHYVTDGLAGITIAVIAWYLAGLASAGFAKESQSEKFSGISVALQSE